MQNYSHKSDSPDLISSCSPASMTPVLALARQPHLVEGQQVEALVQGHVEVCTVERHTIDRAGLASTCVTGVKHVDWRCLTHVPQADESMASGAAHQGRRAVGAEAVHGLVERLLPCSEQIDESRDKGRIIIQSSHARVSPHALTNPRVPEPREGVMPTRQEGFGRDPLQLQHCRPFPQHVPPHGLECGGRKTKHVQSRDSAQSG